MNRKRNRNEGAFQGGDLAVAAFAAGGGSGVALPPQQFANDEAVIEGDLPSVDDLEVAAAAASGVLEESWVVRRVLGERPPLAPPPRGGDSGEDSEEDSSSSSDAESSSDDEGEVSGSEGEGRSGAAPAPALARPMQGLNLHESQRRVALQLDVADGGSVRVSLLLPGADGSDGMDVDGATPLPSSSESDSSDSDTDDEDGTTGAPLTAGGYAALKAEVSAWYDAAAGEEDAPHGVPDSARAEKELGMAPAPEAVPERVGEGEELRAAGTLRGVVEGLIMVAGAPGSRPLDQGSLLCLQDRCALGKVEDVIGVVDAPFYALRYAGGGEMPASAVPGAPVFSVVGSSCFLGEADLAAARTVEAAELAGEAAGEDADVDEFAFSDDEKEAQFRAAARAAAPPQALASNGARAAAQGGRGGRHGGRGAGRRGGAGRDGGRDGGGRGGRGRTQHGGRGGYAHQPGAPPGGPYQGYRPPPQQQQQQQHWQGPPMGAPSPYYGGQPGAPRPPVPMQQPYGYAAPPGAQQQPGMWPMQPGAGMAPPLLYGYAPQPQQPMPGVWQQPAMGQQQQPFAQPPQQQGAWPGARPGAPLHHPAAALYVHPPGGSQPPPQQ